MGNSSLFLFAKSIKELTQPDARKYYNPEHIPRAAHLPKLKRSLPLCMILGVLVPRDFIKSLQKDVIYEVEVREGVLRLVSKNSVMELNDLALLGADRVH